MSKTQNFIKKIAPIARKEYMARSKWVLPSVCIAQAALETGWGTSQLMTKANAYFGIKASKSWTGKVYSSQTQECYDGVNYTTITDTFRAYSSVEQSVADYFDLITGLERYSGAVNNPDAVASITAIKNGGYATSPTYIKKITSIINQYNLTQYDNRCENTTATIKSVEEIAKEVIAGKWGNGQERKDKLAAAGYNYTEVQNRVNALCGKHTTPTPTPTERTYTVKPNDTLWGIAESKLGSGSRYSEIKKLNNLTGNTIYVGQVLKLPN